MDFTFESRYCNSNVINLNKIYDYLSSSGYNILGDDIIKQRYKGKFVLNKIRNENLNLQLKNKLEVNYYLDGDMYYCDIPELEVYAVGYDAQELYDEIVESIIDTWIEIVECDINDLNPKTKLFREKVKGLIDKI